MTFQWQRPRTIGLDGATLAKAKTYEAAHSLPGEPYDVEPAADLRDRVLALTRLVPILPPCEQDEDGPDIDCISCEDSGEIRVGEWGMPFPCPDCGLSDVWNQWTELADDVRRGK